VVSVNKKPEEISSPPPLENTISILDGASSLPETRVFLTEQHGIASDPERTLEERLEAFEDVIDSEVGDTSMVRSRNTEKEVGFRQLYLKFEGGNPTGTQKDRIACSQAMDALRRGYDGITVATCGNYGVAMAFAASIVGIRCFVFVPKNYRSRRLQEISDLNAQIKKVNGDYEQAVQESRRFAEEQEYYDANPGGTNTAIQLRAYGEIAYEIYDELRDAPKAVAVPVSNGTTIAGIHKGFLSLYRRGKTSRIPWMIAGSSSGKNPIVSAFLKNLAICEDLKSATIRETDINEPLINWHSADGNYALEAIRNSHGWAGNASDRMMRKHSKLIREKEGLNVLPASTAGLIALIDYHRKNPLEGDRYVAVLTGRRE
jgi:threonine synthase